LLTTRKNPALEPGHETGVSSTPNPLRSRDAPARSFAAEPLSSSEPQRRVPPFPRLREASARAFPLRRPRLCPIGGRAGNRSAMTGAMKAMVVHVPRIASLRRGLDEPPELINHFLIAMLDGDARREHSGNDLSRKSEGANAPRVADGGPSTLWE
jgi:hypothetical protein